MVDMVNVDGARSGKCAEKVGTSWESMGHLFWENQDVDQMIWLMIYDGKEGDYTITNKK